MTPAYIGDIYILRFVVCSRYAESKDIDFAFKVIKELTDTNEDATAVLLNGTAENGGC